MSALPHSYDLIAAVLAEVQAMRAELAQLRQELRALRRRDTSAADAELVQALFAVLKGKRFAAWEVADYATDRSLQYERLRAAVEASIGSADSRRIGKALKRLQGMSLSGLVIEREGENREGALWPRAGVRELTPSHSHLQGEANRAP